LKGLWTVESRVEFAFLSNLNEILIYVLIEVKFIFILILFEIFKFDPWLSRTKILVTSFRSGYQVDIKLFFYINSNDIVFVKNK
jgi:hypothetical protein